LKVLEVYKVYKAKKQEIGLLPFCLMLWLVIVVVGRGKAWSRVSSGRFILLIGLWGLGVHLSEGRIAVCRLVKFAAPEPISGCVVFLVVSHSP